MMRHRKVRDVHRPRSPVRFEAGNHWRRKRWVGEAADCDPHDVRCGGDLPVHGRTALRAEVVCGPPAVAGAKRSRLPAFGGKRPRRRWAFDRDVLDRKSRLHAEHAARPPLALIALAQGYALWVGTVVGKAELSAIARSLTGGHFPSCSLESRSWDCLHGFDLARPPGLVEERGLGVVEPKDRPPALAGDGLEPVVGLAVRRTGPEVEVGRTIRVGLHGA